MAVIYYLFLVFLCLLGDVSCKITPKSNSRAVKYAKYYKYTEPKQEISIPVMIHIDNAMAEQIANTRGYKNTVNGRRRLNFKPKLILKKVEKLLKSLDESVNLKLVNFRVVNNHTLDMDENISEYLRNYCAWQKNMKLKRGKPYFSILLTGLDVYYIRKNGQKVKESTGRGYMGRMCSMHRSCAVIKWHERDLVYLLAHEMAHRVVGSVLFENTFSHKGLEDSNPPKPPLSLGVYHDGTNNRCRAGYIMATQYSRDNVPQHWSTCSRTHFKEFLRNKEKSWCVTSKVGDPGLRKRNVP